MFASLLIICDIQMTHSVRDNYITHSLGDIYMTAIEFVLLG